MTYSADQLAEQLIGELALDHQTNYFLAFSGGLDSTVLLHTLSKAREQTGFNLVALHANHNLHSDSHLWTEHCASICANLKVEFRQVSLQLTKRSELAAREARYSWFREQLNFAEEAGQKNVLMTAHHQQDRAETLLFNLMRGAGSSGLSSLRPSRPFAGARLMRPLLKVSQQVITDYAELHDLRWVEDPSNHQMAYSRNQIRHQVLPVLERFRPDAVINIARTAANLEQENSLLREIAICDLVEVREHPKHPIDNSHALCFDDLQHLSTARQANLLRFWLRSLNLHTPSKRLLDQLLAAFVKPPESTAILQEEGCQFRFYRGFMYVMPTLEMATSFSAIDWRNINQPVDLYHKKIRVDATPKLRELIYHRSGSLRLAARSQVSNPKALQGHSLNLKKWMQEIGIPPWRRQALPLLTLCESDRDMVLSPVDQQSQSDWVSLECPLN